MSGDQRDPVVAYLNANFRPDVAEDLLAAAQPLMAIAWNEGYLVAKEAIRQLDPTNPYTSQA